MTRSLATFALLLTLLVSRATAEGGSWKASEVVTSYVSGTSPTLILGLDDNLDVCLALQEPRTLEQLREDDLPVTESQILLLRLWDLVEKAQDGTLRCTVPVIRPPLSDRIERLAHEVAETIVDTDGPVLDGFLESVDTLGWSGHRYALLGSFVLDGLVWDALQELGTIDSADPSRLPTGSDFWSGVTWIRIPPQEAKLGTDSHGTDRGTFFTAWTPPALERQAELRRAGLREELTAAALGASEIPPEHVADLEALGLLRAGRATIPGIRSASPLCLEGGQTALAVARTLSASPEANEIVRATGAADRSVAWIMAYHTIYPEVLDLLEARGLEQPALLAGDPDGELAPTLFAVADGTECVETAETKPSP